MIALTRAQQRVLDFVQTEFGAGRSIPTFREIADRFGFRSHRAVACHLEALKRKGFIESEPGKARSLRVTSPLAKLRSRVVDIPVFGSISAGIADNREQEAEGCVTVDVATIGFKPTRNTFALIETELFAQTYKSYGLATIRYPVLEIEASVEAFENGRGYSLRALRAGKPRIHS